MDSNNGHFRFKVVWHDSDGYYAADLYCPNGEPESIAEAWRDADYNGPFTTEREALDSL